MPGASTSTPVDGVQRPALDRRGSVAAGAPRGPRAAVARLLRFVPGARRRTRSAGAERAFLGLAGALFAGATAVALFTMPPIEGQLSWTLLTVAAVVGVPATILLNATEYATVAAMTGARVPLGDALRVSVLSSAANLLPVPGAPVVRVAALGRLGTSLARSAAATASAGLAWLGVTALISSSLLLGGGERVALGAALLVGGAVATLVTWVVLSRRLQPPSSGRVMGSLVAVEAATTLVAAVRLLLVIRGLGFEASIEQCVGLTLASIASSAVAVLRGLGVRELAAGLLSPLVGIDPSVGVAATAVAHLSELALLVPFTAWLAVRMPASTTDVDDAPEPSAGGPTGSTGGLRYVTRKFPPSVGGMELLAASVDQALRGLRPADAVALGRSQRHLPWFLAAAAVRSAWRLARRDVEWVVCGDPVVLAALWPVLRRSRVKVAVVVHGLDLVYPSRIYRAVIRRALGRADRVLTISAATKDEAAGLGVDAAKLADLHPGLPHPARTDRTLGGHELRLRLRLPPSSFLVVTVGRLVPRKGVRFFVSEVLPGLPSHVHYLVAGAGPEHEPIERAAAAAGVTDRVHLLGPITDSDRDALFDGTDLVVMPNLARAGDMEGFGLVALEAALRGAPVVAARIDGLEDALLGGTTGWLCSPGDRNDWLLRLAPLVHGERSALREVGRRFRQEAERHFSPERMQAELAHALDVDPPLRGDLDVIDLRDEAAAVDRDRLRAVG